MSTKFDLRKLSWAIGGALLLALAHLLLWRLTELIPNATRNYQGTAITFLAGLACALLFLLAEQVYNKILVGMLAGIVIGYCFGGQVSAYLTPIGEIFIRLLKMVVVPLVFASLTIGIVSLGDLKTIGRIGGKTVGYFLVTTMLAITIGILLTNWIRPGDYISDASKQKYQQEYQQQLQQKVAQRQAPPNMLVDMVSANPVQSMASGHMLQIICFALLFGLALTTVAAAKKEVIVKGLDGIQDAMVQIVMWIMLVAPLGVLALMADVMAKAGLEVLKALLVYTLVVIGGLALQILIVYGLVLSFWSKIGLWAFLCKIRPVIMVAFSTSSSSATLPISVRCAEEELQIPKEICGFVLPLGATVNMNGTALYLAVAAIFIAQVFNIPLTWADQVAILVSATIAAIGTPGLPSASIIFLVMILEKIQVPAMGIALILGMDRILDMCRTVLNVMGDLTATLFIEATEKKAGQEVVK